MAATTTLTINADAAQAITEIEKLKTAITVPQKGWRTSEFWLTLLAPLAALATLIFHRDFSTFVPAAAVLASTAGVVAYTISRVLVKKAHLAAVLPASGVGTVPDSPAVAPSTGGV